MVNTRRRSAPATPDTRTKSPQSGQTLHRKPLSPTAAGEKWAGSPQSNLTHTPQTPTPTVHVFAIPVVVNKTARSNRSEPTQNRKKVTFTIPEATAFSPGSSAPIPKSVLLYDWWLIKAGEKELAVGGFASRERQGVRVFHSAAIAKRLDTTTLETIDGISVTITGFINRSRTHQNGFPLEVCDHFLLGFPYYWEEYVAKCYNKESSSRGVRTSNPSVDELQMSLDDLPVSRGRDLLMSAIGYSESGVIKSGMLNRILGESIGRISKQAVDSIVKEPPTEEHKTPRVKRNHTKCYDTRYKTTVGSTNVLSPRTGVATRSMTRLSYSKNRQEI